MIVDYRLRRGADGTWKIIDVIAEGISMVANLRSQFQEVITRGGTDTLLAQLRKKSRAKHGANGAAGAGDAGA